MTDEERDELLVQMAADVAQTKDLVIVLARSHVALMDKFESPIMNEIQDDLERQFERQGVSLHDGS